MVRSVLILILIDSLVRCSAYSTYMIGLQASEENVIGINNTRPVLIINEPFTFIIHSNKLLKRLSCHNKPNDTQLVRFLIKVNNRTDFYTLRHELVATAEMKGTLKCILFLQRNKGIKFELEVEVVEKNSGPNHKPTAQDSFNRYAADNQVNNMAYETKISQNPFNNYAVDNLVGGEGFVGKQSQIPLNSYAVDSKVYGRGQTRSQNPLNSYPSYPTSQVNYNDYNLGYGAKRYSPNNDIEFVLNDTLQYIIKNEATISHQYIPYNNVEITTQTKEHKSSTERPPTTNTSNIEKYTSQSNTNEMIVIIAVVIAFTGIVIGVLVGTLGTKIFCRKTSVGDPAPRSERNCSADPVYEELDNPPAAADAAPAPALDIASRPLCPLPPAKREENKKYIHYDTPYDHRFDRPIAHIKQFRAIRQNRLIT